ncbi:hypothetical protein Q31b_56630 [Novipirellula aureliae]|uniref:Uncharacterized protein n=1 Tax=Novipirellula aureliae TaxID=2527966 RepID=A0A5C6DEQ6_9BACT|nr:hypothetical protein [Novipirellula aureliae]TWU33606.1 hypothetical protein Q31b_56630 [Novipirellula aureliae]
MQTELLCLFSRVCDQVATKQELAWLNMSMREDPRVRYLYWEFIAAEIEIQTWINQPDGEFVFRRNDGGNCTRYWTPPSASLLGADDGPIREHHPSLLDHRRIVFRPEA